MSSQILRSGMTLGQYPQKQDREFTALERVVRQGVNSLRFLYQKKTFKAEKFVAKVNLAEQRVSQFSEQELATHIKQQKNKLHRDGFIEEHVVMAFAAIREVAWRTLGKRHYDVQIQAAWIMLNGMVVEMATGEGKTLAASLTACTAAMAGIPVHVVTANDYLAQRDQELLEPLYQQLGLSSAFVIEGMDLPGRQMSYASDILHITSKQLAFDYLRDRMAIGNHNGPLSLLYKQINDERNQQSPLLLKGMCFAIIDEIDSVLIDEARTPLIISKPQNDQVLDQIYFDALFLASSLTENHDFKIDKQQCAISITAEGKQSLEASAVLLEKKWHRKNWREFWTLQALRAKYLFKKDQHYLVDDNKVVIIDENTGRVMPDRSWELGLQQLVEAKENCQISQEKQPLGKISYQRFFRRYLKLAGMSGTVNEVSGELKAIYSLPVIKIPTHKPCRRTYLPERLYQNREHQHQALLEQVKLLHQQGRPILIGTGSVAESETISQLLSKHQLPHQLINARNDELEAEIIASAGQVSKITVATNMAGRGTDIQPDKEAIALGGVHVIATSRNSSRRIDRQLIGRCARQGDPGSCVAILSLESEQLVAFYSPTILKSLNRFLLSDKSLPKGLSALVLRLPQRWLEYRHYQFRKQLLYFENQQAKTLALTGRME